jgi:hypothetical protein
MRPAGPDKVARSTPYLSGYLENTNMNQTGRLIGLGTMSLAGATFVAAVSAQAPQQPPQPMSFFVTSAPKGDGANYGGLAGADAYCQQLGAAAGRGAATWRAYLSTQGPGAVNARDRIGNGPWYNARGALVATNLAELHGDTIEQARLGNRLNKTNVLNEKGERVNGVGDTPNQHDILTGSTADGRAYTDSADHTCSNWTSNANVAPPAPGTAPTPGPSAQLGHSDKTGGTNSSWNSTHPSRGCSQPNLVSTGGAGLLYCFAAN